MVFLLGEYRIWLQLPPRKIDKIDNMEYTIESVLAFLFLNSNFDVLSTVLVSNMKHLFGY